MILNPTSSQLPYILWPHTPLTQLPPPHMRPLYWTIPLPDEDSPFAAEPSSANDTSTSTSTTAWKTPSSYSSTHLAGMPTAPRPTTAGDIVCFVPHPILNGAIPEAERRTPKRPNLCLGDCARRRSVPATTPSMHYLSILVDSTGQLIVVRPSPASGSNTVTVGDVIDVLEDICVTLMDTEGRRRSFSDRRIGRGCECQTISMIRDYLRLQWITTRGTEAGPWHLAVRRR